MFDCHVHSTLSADSTLEAYIACERACQIGLDGIVFTDHVDYDYPVTCEIFFEMDPLEYEKVISKVQSDFASKLQVFKGVEVGLQKSVFQKTHNLLKLNNFDMVIGSIHVIDGLELHNGDFNKGKTKNEAYRIFFDKTLEILREYKDFDVLGHIDIIRRYGKYYDNILTYLDFADVIDEILKNLITNGKGMEINTSGYNYKLNSTLPDIDIVKRYKELGGEILTIGSDSHKVENLANHFELGKNVAINAGFKYLAYFKDRKPQFYNISKD